MRITIISYLLLILMLVNFGACSRPAATAQVVPVPVSTPPVAPAPIISTPSVLAPMIPTPDVPSPAPAQSVFIVSELRMDPAVAILGDYVIVSVKVTNTGKERGSYTVVLKFNDKTIKTQDIVLDGGASGKAELSVVAELPGEYKVTINQLTGRLEVVAQSR